MRDHKHGELKYFSIFKGRRIELRAREWWKCGTTNTVKWNIFKYTHDDTERAHFFHRRVQKLKKNTHVRRTLTTDRRLFRARNPSKGKCSPVRRSGNLYCVHLFGWVPQLSGRGARCDRRTQPIPRSEVVCQCNNYNRVVSIDGGSIATGKKICWWGI